MKTLLAITALILAACTPHMGTPHGRDAGPSSVTAPPSPPHVVEPPVTPPPAPHVGNCGNDKPKGQARGC